MRFLFVSLSFWKHEPSLLFAHLCLALSVCLVFVDTSPRWLMRIQVKFRVFFFSPLWPSTRGHLPATTQSLKPHKSSKVRDCLTLVNLILLLCFSLLNEIFPGIFVRFVEIWIVRKVTLRIALLFGEISWKKLSLLSFRFRKSYDSVPVMFFVKMSIVHSCSMKCCQYRVQVRTIFSFRPWL